MNLFWTKINSLKNDSTLEFWSAHYLTLCRGGISSQSILTKKIKKKKSLLSFIWCCPRRRVTVSSQDCSMGTCQVAKRRWRRKHPGTLQTQTWKVYFFFQIKRPYTQHFLKHVVNCVTRRSPVMNYGSTVQTQTKRAGRSTLMLLRVEKWDPMFSGIAWRAEANFQQQYPMWATWPYQRHRTASRARLLSVGAALTQQPSFLAQGHYKITSGCHKRSRTCPTLLIPVCRIKSKTHRWMEIIIIFSFFWREAAPGKAGLDLATAQALLSEVAACRGSACTATSAERSPPPPWLIKNNNKKKGDGGASRGPEPTF